jgi:hypothetical protein
MKKLLTLLLLCSIGFGAYSQTISQTSVCDTIIFKWSPVDTFWFFPLYWSSQDPIQHPVGGCCDTNGNLYGSIGGSGYNLPCCKSPDTLYFCIPIYDTTSSRIYIHFGNNWCSCRNSLKVTIDAWKCRKGFTTLELCPKTTSINEIGNKSNKKLLRIIDELGRESQSEPNKLLIYIYSDGTLERKIIVKD